MEILIIILLVLLNGIFAMSEMSLVSSRKFKLENARKKGSSGAKKALELSENPTKFLSTVQIVNISVVFRTCIGLWRRFINLVVRPSTLVGKASEPKFSSPMEALASSNARSTLPTVVSTSCRQDELTAAACVLTSVAKSCNGSCIGHPGTFTATEVAAVVVASA